MSGQTPAGWYHDPYGTPGLQRYWDGSQWTQATQPTDEWEDADTTQSGAVPSAAAPVAPPGAPLAPPAAPPGTPQATPPGMPPGAPNMVPPNMAQPNMAQPNAVPPGAGTGAQGPATPPPWTPGPEVQPSWKWEGAPVQGPMTPPPWQPPAQPPARSNTGVLWALGGGGAVIVALIVVVGLFAAGVFDGDSSPTPTPGPTTTAAVPSPNPTRVSPVTGTVTDTAAGVSYVQLGPPWRAQEVDPNGDFARRYGFTRGQIAVVQENYNGRGSEYLSSVYSGRLPTSVDYDGPEDLESAVTSFARTIETEPEPNGSYPTHTREDLESDDLEVNDRRAWFTKFRLTFPQAQARGWNFRTETAVFVLIEEERPGLRPRVVWITIPDSHPNGGDLDRLFESIKVP
ncbi:MAG TPA: DUF2510 domain-containing protein [Thermomonospora sp.]|nr:DUF2510 domain-containing protein [Thermomonospora sp.]